MHPQIVVLIENQHELMSPYFDGIVVRFEYYETVSIPPDVSLRVCTEQLASRLHQSGIGSCESIVLETKIRKDFFVILRNTNYGRLLLDNWLADYGLIVCNPIKPFRWAEFQCDEYFRNGWWDKSKYEGVEDGFSAVSDKTGIYEDVQNDFLAIGWPGIDGVMFGYRRHMAGIWACYPGEKYFREMATDLDGLQDGWTNGPLAV